MLEVNQHSANNKQLFNKDGLIAWTADDLKTGDKYLAVFNATVPEKKMNTITESEDQIIIPVKLDQLGITGTCTIKDIWSNKVIGDFTNEFAPVIRCHASGLYVISVKK
jgi:hypothetical protein